MNSNDITRWNAELYHNNSKLQEYYALELLKTLSLKGTEQILDIGCGDGKITAYIAQNLVPQGKVIGVDRSKEMIEFARTNFGSEQQYSNLEFEVSDATLLPFSNQFDYVFSFWCLQWVENQELALQQIKKVLKPGGKLVLIITGLNEEFKEMMANVRSLIKSPKWHEALKDIPFPWAWPQIAQEYQKVIERVGFSQYKIQDVRATFKMKNKQAFILGYAATNLYARVLGQDKAVEFITEVFEDYLKDYPLEPDGSMLKDASYLLVEAQKSK